MKKIISIFGLLLLLMACEQAEVTRTWVVIAKNIVPPTRGLLGSDPQQYNIYLQESDTGERRMVWAQIMYFVVEVGDKVRIHQKGSARLIYRHPYNRLGEIKWWKIVAGGVKE